jgi:hypothetical protein
VKIGGWSSILSEYHFEESQRLKLIELLRDFTIENPPPEGWLPASNDDPLIQQLFDKYWPVS